MKIKHIMIVDDSPSDLDLIADVLNSSVDLTLCGDGEQALQTLKHGTLPDLIILDLHMPKVSGFEVLDYVKTNPGLEHIPMIVFADPTSSDNIRRSYELRASAFLTKPLDLHEFVTCIRSLKGFWVDWVTPYPDQGQ